MNQICVSCDGKINNTGRSASDKVFGLDSALIYVPLTASDGTVNSLDLTASDLDAELLGKFNNPDPTKRWYLVQKVQSVTSETAEATFETSPTNERFKLLDGIQNFNYGIWDISRAYFNQLSAMCVDFGIVRIDDCGNMLGELSDDSTEFYPRAVNKYSYSAIYQNKAADASPKALIDFDFERLTKSGNQVMLDVNSFTYNPLRMSSMLQAVLTVLSVDSATEVSVKVELIYGTALNKIPVEGLAIADFDIFDQTAGASIAPVVGVTDGVNAGEYKITTPATVTGQLYDLSVFKAALTEREQGIESYSAEYESL